MLVKLTRQETACISGGANKKKGYWPRVTKLLNEDLPFILIVKGCDVIVAHYAPGLGVLAAIFAKTGCVLLGKLAELTVDYLADTDESNSTITSSNNSTCPDL